MSTEHDLDTKKACAKAWFESLRDQICAEFERLEDEAPADLYPGASGRFEKKPWDRPAGGGRFEGASFNQRAPRADDRGPRPPRNEDRPPRRDDAPRPLFRCQRKHGIGRAAQLEAAGRLVVFELKANGHAAADTRVSALAPRIAFSTRSCCDSESCVSGRRMPYPM